MSGPDDASAAHAMQRLLAEFGPRLRAIVLARSPSGAGLDPDEVEQQVRRCVQQAVDGGQAIAHPASWLYRTTMAVIAERLAHVGALTQAGSDEALSALLAEVLAAMPERQRLPVQLHLQGFGFAEVARLLEASEATARNHVARGMEEVRVRLGAAGWR